MNRMKGTAGKLLIVTIIVLAVTATLPLSAGAQSIPGTYAYTVKSGDTLSAIAAKAGISVDALRVINGLYTDMIYPGEVFLLPADTGRIFSRYTVVPGDSLYWIARSHGVSVSAIQYANALPSTTITPGEVLTIPYMQFGSLGSILAAKGIPATSPAIDIFVDKTEHTVLLFSKGTWLKTYHCELGQGGLGDKQVRGDEKTPEGTFYICQKTIVTDPSKHIGTRYLRVSYPNIEDAARGLWQGIIGQSDYNDIAAATNAGTMPPQWTDLGGGVGIHGGTMPGGFDYDWTWGCMGLTNADIEDMYNYIQVGARLVIQY